MRRILTSNILSLLSIVVILGFCLSDAGAAPSRVKTWVDGETLWAADLNAEFDAIIAGFSAYVTSSSLASTLSGYMPNSKAAVEAVLTGVIYTHSHTGAAPALEDEAVFSLSGGNPFELTFSDNIVFHNTNDYVKDTWAGNGMAQAATDGLNVPTGTGYFVSSHGFMAFGTGECSMHLLPRRNEDYHEGGNDWSGTTTYNKSRVVFNWDTVNHTATYFNGGINMDDPLSLHDMVYGAGTALVWDTTSHEVMLQTSSLRFKKDVEPLEADWNKIMSLKPITFRYDREPDSTPAHPGFAAEDMHKVYPGAVSLDDGGVPFSIHDGSLTAPLAAAIQSLKRENDELKKRVERLEKKLEER